MRHFLRIASGLDVIPALNALQNKPDLWNANDLRTTHDLSPHTECDDIWLFFNEYDPSNPAEAIDAVQTVPYPAWSELPEIQPMVLDLMRRVGGVQLGRVIVTRLPPGGKITPHIDEGTPATFYTRYQIALQSYPGCVFRSGPEEATFSGGDVWWIDNRSTHSVTNNSGDDRIVVIVDVRLPC